MRVDKLSKMRENRFMSTHADPVQYWSYLFLYTGCGFYLLDDYLSSFYR